MQFKSSVLANPCKILYMKHKSKIMRRRSRVGSPRSLSRMRYRWFRTAGMNLVNLICTDSIISIKYLWWGFQTCEQYSSSGRTYMQNAFVRMVLSLEVNDRFSRRALADAFLYHSFDMRDKCETFIDVHSEISYKRNLC